jgi:hypothetical protein
VNKQCAAQGLEWSVQEYHYWISVSINKKKALNFRKEMNYNAAPNDGADSLQSEFNDMENEDENFDDNLKSPMPVITQTDGNLFTAARDDEGADMINTKN